MWTVLARPHALALAKNEDALFDLYQRYEQLCEDENGDGQDVNETVPAAKTEDEPLEADAAPAITAPNSDGWEQVKAAHTTGADDEDETESLLALSVRRDHGSSPTPSVSKLDGMEHDGSGSEMLQKDTGELLTNDEKSLQDLPSGWVELLDEASGQTYYFNESKGTTSWDRPVEINTDEISNVHDNNADPDIVESGDPDAVEGETDSLLALSMKPEYGASPPPSVSELDEEITWIEWFCHLKGNEFFVEVDEEFAGDDFNLTNLDRELDRAMSITIQQAEMESKRRGTADGAIRRRARSRARRRCRSQPVQPAGR